MLNSVSIQLDMAPGLKNFKFLSDVTFSVENKLFYLHKAILMSRCKFFEGMLSHNFREKVNWKWIISDAEICQGKRCDSD